MKLITHRFLIFSNAPRLVNRYYSSEFFSKKYDVIVVGGGHAGVEACCAASRMGVNSLLITHKKESIGNF